MPNPYSVYMHDTSHKEFFSADYRFQSSGCTRVEDPRALATWLLADNPGWGRARDRRRPSPRASGPTSASTHKVPVAWVYLTGWATRDNVIHFRDDVYGHDDKPTLVADARAARSRAPRAPPASCCNQRTRGIRRQAGVVPRQPVGSGRGVLHADIGDALWPLRRSRGFARARQRYERRALHRRADLRAQRRRRDAVRGPHDFGPGGQGSLPLPQQVGQGRDRARRLSDAGHPGRRPGRHHLGADRRPRQLSRLFHHRERQAGRDQGRAARHRCRHRPHAIAAQRSASRWRRIWRAPTKRSTACRRTSGRSSCASASPRSRSTTPAAA